MTPTDESREGDETMAGKSNPTIAMLDDDDREEIWRGSLDALLAENAGGLTDHEVASIRALDIGDETAVGGGAGTQWPIVRVA